MNTESSKIIAELCEILKKIKQGQRFSYDFSELPESGSEEINLLRNEIQELTVQYCDNYKFVIELSKGNLEVTPPAKNSFANHYKQLHADLQHLTWQIQQISEGDLEQKVSFSGDFSLAINKMIESLKEKKRISDLNEKYLEELKELNATKDKFFSIISHDLKNPFAGLLGICEVLISEIQDKNYDILDEYVTLIKEFSEQGYKLLVNLLDWSRLQRGMMEVNLEPISLAAIVKDAKSTIWPKAVQKNIQITCKCDHDYIVIADQNMLNTVTRNLLSNAVKFTNEGGQVTITGEPKDDKIIVSVEDNGVGITPENISRLFRIDGNICTKGTNREDGTGLGLVLCKDFIKKMGGDIWVTSEVGKGSIFSFVLPVAEKVKGRPLI
jgi:signal transduction histidine kinase